MSCAFAKGFFNGCKKNCSFTPHVVTQEAKEWVKSIPFIINRKHQSTLIKLVII